MNNELQQIHPDFAINGKHYSIARILLRANKYINNGLPFEVEIGKFLQEWFNDTNFIEVTTSGSTGIPKPIKLYKTAMLNSAKATGLFFNLQPKNKALLNLPCQYIAGKMMLVRALVLGLDIDIVAPKAKIEFPEATHYDFCAMLPMQLENLIHDTSHFKTIIVGGAPIPKPLRDKIKNTSASIFETYGMTETCTHIAVKKCNKFSTQKEQLYFKTLPNIYISEDQRNCLCIDAPQLKVEQLQTNDIVKIHTKTTFEWLGRYDLVINSGGIKLFPEQIEKKLATTLQTPFFIYKELDATLGERVVLVLESEKTTINAAVFKVLSKYEIPKKVYFAKQFLKTETGKILRKDTYLSLNL